VFLKQASSALAFIAICTLIFPGAATATGQSRHADRDQGASGANAMHMASPAEKSSKAGKRSSARALAAGAALTGVAVAADSTDLQGARRDGEAESRLLEIYRLIGQAKIELALQRAQSLVNAHPNFQLAHLVYGDLLSSRSRPLRAIGDVPDTTARVAEGVLSELREESQMRLKALRERPPAGTVPSQFLLLSPRNRHAIAVDASRSRLYLFENTTGGLKLLADYYISLGKSGTDKVAEGDLRTPLGVYFITSTIGPRSLKEFYGAGALPINYPNPLDTRLGRTGSGIWLHGTPPAQFARAPKASDGCVVLANPDLKFIMSTVEIRSTPVVIAPSLDWVQPHSVHPEVSAFEAVLQGWRIAKSTGDLARTLTYYAPDFANEGRDLNAWTPVVRKEIERASGREIALKELSVLRWKDNSVDTMVVTFGEVVEGTVKGPKKRQYWARKGNQWKIFFEGVIG
jgi:murein L,D-transpeptidase YafK